MKKTLVSIVVIMICYSLMMAQHDKFDPATKLRVAEKVIETYYVDSVATGEMVDKAIVAMLKTLDPHSTYSDPAETRELTEPLQGNFSGVGIQFNMHNDTLYILETIGGGPAEKVGIVAGDRILRADGKSISGVKMANSDVIKTLRGPKGSTVEVEVMRKGSDHPITFRIIRDDIPLYSVESSYMAAPGVGYVKISRFAEATPEEFVNAIDKLRKEGMLSLIVDLQDNGGGYLQSATMLSEMFLSKGDPIVSTRGDKLHESVFKAERHGVLRDLPVAVLVNQYSASASEILSGAIQDNDRGLIIGRRTFGKGLVQRPFPLPDGSMIRLTVARYFTPSGRCIQKPYTAGEEEDYRDDINKRYKAGEFSSADSIHFADSLRYNTLRNGRIVYGGGGIMPDRFVAIDTTYFTDYSRDLVAKGVLNSFCVDYIDSNRKAIKRRYPTANSFIDNFQVDSVFLQGIIEAGLKEGVEFNSEQFEKSKEYLSTILKAILASDLYGRGNYYRVVNTINPIYTEALRVMTTEGEYERIIR